MLNDAKDLQAVYIVCGYTDLRKGIDSLSNISSQTYGMDPFQPGTLFMFCGRKTDRIKALIWEGDGFLLCYKRLEQKASKFQWPRSQEEVCKLTSQQFRWLMEGLTIKPKKCIQKIDHPRIVWNRNLKGMIFIFQDRQCPAG